MKKWQVILGTIVALVMTASIPLSSLAQNADEATAARKPTFSGSLAIVAPRSVPVAKEMSLGVFQRENQNPVPGAGVWALTREKVEEVKKAVNAQTVAEDIDYEALLGSHGSFLGRTGGDGRLVHTFKESGQYILVAAKKGYVPDFSPLAVRDAPADALVIKAPRMSPPGESVTITVAEKANGEPVKDAGVWALTPTEAEALKARIGNSRATANATPDIDIESIIGGFGIFLGRTHGNGELKYTFDTAGKYILVAAKKGYVPGYTGIAIVAHNTTKPSGKPTPRANEKANPGNGPTNNSTANSTRVK